MLSHPTGAATLMITERSGPAQSLSAAGPGPRTHSAGLCLVTESDWRTYNRLPIITSDPAGRAFIESAAGESSRVHRYMIGTISELCPLKTILKLFYFCTKILR
jgi:hypothetical protein